MNPISKLKSNFTINIKCLLLITIFGIFFGIVGYYLGIYNSLNHLQKEEVWKKMNSTSSGKLLESALKYGEWSKVSQQTSIDTLPLHLDTTNVPDGDMSVPSKKVHSGRYIISQWQRVAAGASVVVLGRDKEQDLCVALGTQRGELVIAQGYMESYLPKEDFTGLGKNGASRINRTTGELIYADSTLKDVAAREVKEELGIVISKNSLQLIDVFSGRNTHIGLHVVEGIYGIILPNTAELKTLDTEFVQDDMQRPFWTKIKNIKCIKNNCYTPNNSLPIEKRRILIIQKTINLLGTDSDKEAYKSFLSLNIQ